MRLVAQLAVSDEGSGPIVLFLHGIGSSRHAFRDQVEHFRHSYRCLCPDAPGYGDSPDRPMVGIDSYAAAYEDLITELAPGASISIVGVSFGGVVATRMAVRGRVDVASLVLADTSAGSGVDPLKASAMLERIPEMARTGVDEFARRRSPRLLSPAADPDLVIRVTDMMRSSIRPPGYADAVTAMARADNRSALEEIECPVLVLVGEHDVVCPPSVAESLVARIRRSELLVIPGAGHLANQEQPALFDSAVSRFLGQTLDRSDGTSHDQPQQQGV